MKLNAVLAAALSLGFALTSHAATFTVTTDAYLNSTSGGVGADVGLALVSGESFTVSTDASTVWHGAFAWDGNYDRLSSNADGAATADYASSLYGIADPVHVGTLVADIDGDFRVIGAGTKTFTAWETGEIFFHYTDVNNGDNSGDITSQVSTVPEPANLALLLAGLGMMGAVARRRSAR